MDKGAAAYYDKLVEGIGVTFEEGLARVADSPEKRKMRRLVALTRRKHQRVENSVPSAFWRWWNATGGTGLLAAIVVAMHIAFAVYLPFQAFSSGVATTHV